MRKKNSAQIPFKFLIILSFLLLPQMLFAAGEMYLGLAVPPTPIATASGVSTQASPSAISPQASPSGVSGSASGVTGTASAVTQTATLASLGAEDMTGNGKGPANFKVQAEGMKITLSWSAAQGGTDVYYNIYRSTDQARADFIKINKDDSLQSLTYIDNSKNSFTRPKQKIKYFYKVASLVLAKETGETDMLTVTPTGPLVPPPADSISFKAADKEISLAWEEPESSGEYDLSGFNVFRSTDSSNNGNKLNEELLKKYTYDDFGEADNPLDNAVKYYYKLQSVDSAGNTSDFSVQIAAEPHVSISEPKNVTAAVSSNESIKLAWGSPEVKGTFGLSGYNIFRSSIAGVFPDQPINVNLRPEYTDDAGKVFYFDNIINSVTPPEMGVTYYYKILPMDMKGNTGTPSAVITAGIAYLNVPQSGIVSAEMSQYGLPPESKLTVSGMKTVDLSYGQVWPSSGLFDEHSKGVPAETGAQDKTAGPDRHQHTG